MGPKATAQIRFSTRLLSFSSRPSGRLTKNQVFTLWEDKDVPIRVGTSEEIGKIAPSIEKFTRIEQNAKNANAFNYAQSFKEHAAGNFG